VSTSAPTDSASTSTTDARALDDQTHPEVNISSEDYHIYGDIVQVRYRRLPRPLLAPKKEDKLLNDEKQLIPATEDVMRHRPYVTFSGIALNRTESSFDVNAPQYTSFYKAHRSLSTLPLRAAFDDTRYKTKKPIPSNNTYVAVEGFLMEVETDSSTGRPTVFHVSVDNINFLGKAVSPPSRGACE
jgi:hypothetical protein